MPSSVQWSKLGFGTAVSIAYALGAAFGLGIGLTFFSDSLKDFGLYLISMSVFHMWEYMYVVTYHPNDLSSDSFMVTHSRAFHVALAACLFEYFFEWLFFPSLKGHAFMYVLGFTFVVLGQGLRIVAMITAAKNFSHMIAERKKETHNLVTHGVYSYVRHPSYTGWFAWSIATQVILGNPICIVAYTVVVWNFFNDRIAYEEETLIEFFGDEYKKFKKTTPSGIPLVK